MTAFVLGALHLDVVVDAPHLPRLGETLTGTAVDYRFGGKGGNQALAVARMGVPVAMAGRVGRDRFGAQIRQALESAGVDHTRVSECDVATGMSVAITEAAGDYGAVIVSAANLQNDGSDDLPPDMSVCLLQNEIPNAANVALAARLPDGATLIVNAAPARPLSPDLASRIDILVVNTVEAEDMTGKADPSIAANALRDLGPGTVIVTLGADGALIADTAGQRTLPAHLVDVISTHGAGDAFTGTLAADLAAGASLDDAIRTAQAAAALIVSTSPADRHEITEAAIRLLATQSMP